MGLWTKKDELKAGQTTQPILWTAVWPEHEIPLPECTVEDCIAIFGDGPEAKSKRLQTFGHENGNFRDGKDPHFITIRNGYGMHTDPGFVRFTHHVVLLNEGYHVNGISGLMQAPMGRGAMYCIDSHSPHAVIPDPRLGTGIYKLQAAVDADQPLSPEQVIEKLAPLLSSGPKPHLAVR